MHRRILIALLFTAGALWFAGCAARHPTRLTAVTEPPPPPVAPAKDVPLTKEEQEARAEALAHYATGVSYELKGQNEKAMEEYYLSALAAPANESFVLDLSQRLIKLKKPEKAAEILIKAAAQPGASGMVDALLGVAYAQDGKKELAIASSLKAVQKSPGDLQGYQNLFHLYLQTGQPREALKALDDASAVNSNDISFLVDLADLYVRYLRDQPGQMEKVKPRVVSVLEALVKLQPENPNVMQRIGETFLKVGEFKKGGEIFSKLLAQFSGQPAVRDRLRAILTDIYLQSGEPKKAAEELEALIKNDPTNPQAYLILAGINHDVKDYAKAAEYYKKAILLNPDLEDAYYGLAFTQLALEQPKESIATLDKAREKFKSKFVGEFYSALAYNSMKDYAKGVKHMLAAELAAKTSEPARLTHVFYFQLGSTYERNKDFAQAEKSFQECLRLSPDFAEGLNYLGYMWAERGEKLDQALPLIEKAVKLEPDNGAYLDSLAWVLFKLGKAKEALGHMQKAIAKTEKPDATLFDHLGDIQAALHRPDAARDAWRKAIAIEPNKEIQKKLDAPPATKGTP